jgi:mono/diheme cytochrome c family protein
MFRTSLVAMLILAGGLGADVRAQAAREPSRGELLYANHCIACHTAQVHWRQKKIAKDLKTLQSEVRRWQADAGLGWSDEDIADVTRYLNALHYRFSPAG